MKETVEIVNARIASARLGFERDIFLSATLSLEYGGSMGQSYGGHVFCDVPSTPGGERRGTAYGTEAIMRILRTVGVETWADLDGRLIRVRREAGWGGAILGIGHPLEDLWFSFKDLADEMKGWTS